MAYCTIDDTTGHSKLHSDVVVGRVSRYMTLSHHAGILFFSPESYPRKMMFSIIPQIKIRHWMTYL